jgi:hypothetical protein
MDFHPPIIRSVALPFESAPLADADDRHHVPDR